MLLCRSVHVSVGMTQGTTTRTNTRRLGVVESESDVARHTIRGTVHRTMHAGLRQPIAACARIHCNNTRCVEVIVMFACEAFIDTRTNALCAVAVESKPGVARHTLRSAVHGTMDAGLWGAIPARAYICCERTTHRIYYDHAFLLGFMLVQASTRAHTDTLTYEHTWPSHG